MIEVDPNDASGHFNLGIALAATGDTVDGQNEINKGIQLNPALVTSDPPFRVRPRRPSPSASPEATPEATPTPTDTPKPTKKPKPSAS